MKYNFGADRRKKITDLCGTERKKKMCFFFLLKAHKEDKLGVFFMMIIWVLQPQRVEGKRKAQDTQVR